MIRPYSARVAAGLLATVVEETRKLPTYAVTLPMTAVSQALQAGMRLQQNVAELAIKGDTVLDDIFNQDEEQPQWARFDEDEVDEVPAPADDSDAAAASGRFALYTSAPDEVVSSTKAPAKKPAATTSGDAPEIAELLDYDNLTLAQLRAKIRTVDLDDLTNLAGYEKSNKARAPFVTMLENRIAAKADK